MGINYGRFTLDLISNGDSILVPTTNFIQLTVRELPNSIPECELVISSMNEFHYTKYNDITVSIQSKYFDCMYDIGIKNIDVKNVIKFSGLLCDSSCFNEVQSAYLGEDLSSAISALNIKPNVVGVDKVSGDYWQFSETKIDALYNLMSGCCESGIYTINNDTIKAINIKDRSNALEFIQPSHIIEVSYNKLLNSDDIYSMYKSEKDGKSIGYTAQWVGEPFVGIDHIDFVNNMISSLRYNRPPAKVMKFHYDNFVFPYNVGDIMKVDVDRFNVDIMRVMGKITTYSADKFTTDVLLGIQDTE